MEGRYRAVGRKSSVDESLFGTPQSGRRKAGMKNTSTGPLAPSSIVISAEELARLRGEAVIKTESEILEERERARQLKEQQRKLANERKDRMRELEKKSVMLAKKSDEELADIARKQAIRKMAEEKIDDSSDVVKLMNSMALQATAFTIRDQQLAEKERLASIEKAFDKKMDILIEIDRLKDIQKREEEESAKRIKRVQDRSVINEQIADRERQRMLALEAREQENQQMRSLMQKYKDEDERRAEKHKIEVEESRLAVLKANQEAIERKKLSKLQEQKEMEDILIYQAMKDAEAQKREDDELALAKAKKERQAMLLEKQERAQNNQGKLDEIRARRAAEQKERTERQKERAEALKRKADMKELLDSRAKQAADKLERQKLMHKQQEEVILQQLLYTKKMDERESQERNMKTVKSLDHKSKLQQQIEENERRRKIELAQQQEGTVRQEMVKEEAKLLAIRDKMVEDLIEQGVNSKYLSDLKHFDVGKITRR